MGAGRHRVTVEPRDIEFEVDDGEAIMAAAQRNGYRWPTLCRGDGTCTICWAEVKVGAEQLSTIELLEQGTLELLSPVLRATRTVRLACQARVHGDVTLRKTGVRPAADS